MKSVWLILGVMLVSVNAFAIEKICFGLKDDSGSSGQHFMAKFTKSKVEVQDGDYKGSYSRFKGAAGKLLGKDGKTYFVYDTNGDEGCTQLLVNEALLEKEGKGQMKFRCRGEGFGDTKFFCRDEKDKE